MNQQAVRRSLRLLSVEMVITSVVMAMPVLTIFFNSLGMSMEQIGLSQAAFTLGVMLFNIPSGHLADIFGRKWFNLLGDTLAALAFVYYAFFAQSFVEVVLVEFVLGIGLAFSGGADTAMFEAYCKELGYKDWQQRFAKLNEKRVIAEATGVLIGGAIGAFDPRLAIACSVATYGAGALLTISLVEVGEKRQIEGAYHRDLWRVLRYSLHEDKRLKWSIVSAAFAREMTHPSVWVLTPILLLASIPPHWVGMGWALNSAAVWLGNRLARQYATLFNDAHRVLASVAVVMVGASVLTIHVSLATVWLFGAFGLVRGWNNSAVTPMVQQNSPADIKTSVSSVSGTIANLIYIPFVWWMGQLGDISPQTSMMGVLAFALLGVLPSALFLRKYVK